MPIRKPVIFQKSLLAVAVISLSACSTTSRLPDYDLGNIGTGIVNAGKSTADFSRRAWNRTTYLLGFTDGESNSKDSLILDDNDLALREQDADTLSGIVTRPVVQEQATAYDLDKSGNLPEIENNEQLALVSESQLSGGAIKEDLVHEVAPSENLWKIAKMTTGNATNWHVLADVNNLAPDAAVFPGQSLVIPAEMVKADYLAPADVQLAALSMESDAGNQEGILETALVTEDTEADVVLAAAAPERLKIPSGEGIEKQAMVEPSRDGTAFKLKPAETLWDLAKRTTGDALNWKTIAQQNNFSEKQSVVVHAGQTIYVPNHLVDDYEAAESEKTSADNSQSLKLAAKAKLAELETTIKPAAAVQAVTQPEVQPDNESSVAFVASTSAKTDNQAAIDAASKLIAESKALDETKPLEALSVVSPLDETQDIQLAAATSGTDATQLTALTQLQAQPLQEQNQVQRLKIADGTAKAGATLEAQSVDTQLPTEELPTMEQGNSNTPGEIMVSGTYYPKAVYNEADFSSSLLMRVSPGTKLQVSNAMGTWFQVETDKGLGYVHQRDIK